jgi:hypothetical protein
MNDSELKSLWQSANEKASLSFNTSLQNAEDITRMKIQNALSRMKPIKIFTLVVGILWVLLMGFVASQLFIYAFQQVSLFFLISLSLQVLLCAVALFFYLYQLDLIFKIDFSDPVILIQERLSKLKASSLQVARILFLQLPLWTTFYLSENLLQNGNRFLLLFQGLITVLFTGVAIWLFIHIKYENRHQKWFQLIFRGREWDPIIQAMALLDQVKKYQQMNEE